MNNKKDIVVTAYGHDKTIDKFSVSLFESSGNDCHNSQESDAKKYCNTINQLELKGDSWVLAGILSENKQYSPDEFLPLNFQDIIMKLDNRAIQKTLREIDSLELVKSLKNQDELVKEKIFANMTKRTSQMLKEDMEYLGPIKTNDVKEAQEKILSTIRYLAQCGEIIIPSEGETTI